MDRLIAMLARTADGVMLMDQNRKVVLWNRAAERLLGFRADEILGRPCYEVMRGKTPDGRPWCSQSCPIAAQTTRGDPVRNYDLQTQTKAGRRIWLNISALPVPSKKKGQFLVAHLFRDISKQAKVRQLEDELHAALYGAVVNTSPEIQVNQPAEDPPREIPMTPALSEREREVLGLLAAGRGTKSIGDHLCISPFTVRNHIRHILEKLGVRSRLQAVAIAFHPSARAS